MVPNDMQYEPTVTNETIAPHADKLVWKIDGASTAEFPDNVASYRRFQANQMN